MRKILMFGAIIVMVLLNGCVASKAQKEKERVQKEKAYEKKMSERQNLTYVNGNRSDFIGSFGCDGGATMTLQSNGTGNIRGVPVNWKLENGYAFIDVPSNRKLVSKLKKQSRKHYFDLVVVKNEHLKECMKINNESYMQAVMEGIKQKRF